MKAPARKDVELEETRKRLEEALRERAAASQQIALLERKLQEQSALLEFHRSAVNVMAEIVAKAPEAGKYVPAVDFRLQKSPWKAGV